MATSRDVLYSIAIRLGIESAGMSKTLNKISSDMNVFKSGLKLLGKTIAATFSAAAIIGFSKESFAAYHEQFKAEQLLLTALKGRKDVQERLIRQAEYLQKTTLFNDDQIITQQKLLASLGLSEKQIRNVIQAATNLSTALGIDLDSAVMMLTKTLGGNVRELGRLVPEIKGMGKEALIAGDAIEWVNENMKGLAETAANTDPITQMKKAWDELKESFGEFIAPVVTKVSNNLKQLFTVLGSDAMNFGQKLVSVFNFKTENGIGIREELYNQVLALEADQQALDDAKASSESFGRALEQEALSASQVTKNLEAMALSIEKVSRKQMSLQGEGRWDLFPAIKGKTTAQVGFTNENGEITKPEYDLFSKQRAAKERNQEYLLETQQMIQQETLMIESIIEDMVMSWSEAIGTMISEGAKGNWGSMLAPIADAMSRLGQLMIVAGLGLEKLKISITEFGKSNPMIAVIGGAALVAAAAAIKASVQNSLSGGSSSAASFNYSSAGTASENLNRNFQEGYLNVKVEGKIRNDYIYISNKRGASQTARW